MIPPPPTSTLFPYTTLFRSLGLKTLTVIHDAVALLDHLDGVVDRSEEHTSELQSLTNLVCRLLLEKKKTPAGPSEAPCEPGRGHGRVIEDGLKGEHGDAPEG